VTPAEDADSSVLDAVEQTLMNPAVVERAIEHAIVALEADLSDDRRKVVEAEMVPAEQATGHLKPAIAGGG